MGDEMQQKVQEALAQIASGPQMEVVQEFIARLVQNSRNTGLSPLECLGLTPSALEGYYKRAFQMYKAGKFNEAKKILKVIVMMCPTEHKFGFALAACYHRSGEYGLALAGYQTASLADPTDPLPYYHAADCLLKLGMQAGAIESLHIAVKNCGTNPTFAPVKDRATMALQKLQPEGASAPPGEAGGEQSSVAA